MADDKVTAANLCDQFIEEQKYIQKYIEFVQHKTAMFESQVTELSNILSKNDLIKIERRRWARREPYSHEELQQLYDQLQRTLPAIATESEKTASELESLQKPPELYSIDERSFQGECIQYMIDALEYNSSPDKIEASCRDLMEQIRVHNLDMGVSLRKTSSNGNTRFRTDKIYESLIELVEVSGSTKAFLHNRLGNRQALFRRV